MQFCVGARVRIFEKVKHCTLSCLWSITAGCKQYRNGFFNTIVGRSSYIQKSNASCQSNDVIFILARVPKGAFTSASGETVPVTTELLFVSFTQKLSWAKNG